MKMRITCARWTPDIPIHVSSLTFYIQSASPHSCSLYFIHQLTNRTLCRSVSVKFSIVCAVFSPSPTFIICLLVQCFYCYIQRNRSARARKSGSVQFFVDDAIADILVQCLDTNREYRKLPAFSTIFSVTTFKHHTNAHKHGQTARENLETECRLCTCFFIIYYCSCSAVAAAPAATIHYQTLAIRCCWYESKKKFKHTHVHIHTYT